LLKEQSDHRPNVCNVRPQMNPMRSNFNKSEYVLGLMREREITPMYQIEVDVINRPIGEAHREALEAVETWLTNFMGENDVHHNFVEIVRDYDMHGVFDEPIVKMKRLICLEHGYQYVIMHQFTHVGYEDNTDGHDKAVQSLQVGFLSLLLNNKVETFDSLKEMPLLVEGVVESLEKMGFAD